MKIFYCDTFVLPLPPGHRFPMEKYSLLRERVAAELVPPAELLVPAAATDEELLRAHEPAYIRAVSAGTLDAAAVRRIGFPWSPALVERSRRSVGGTIAACRAALEDGLSANLAGGTHHAFAGSGEGFCVFNDAAVAARAMQAERRARRVAILDCDVHQGNGTAAIFRDDPTVYTFSVHGANNFPFRKVSGDLDLALPDGTGDAPYLDAVEEGVRHALACSLADLAIYIAGADPHAGDRLGRLEVSARALAERDRLVYDLCARAGAAVAVVMGGGYGRVVAETVSIHHAAVREAVLRVRAGRPAPTDGRRDGGPEVPAAPPGAPARGARAP